MSVSAAARGAGGLGAWAGAASRRGAECEAGRPGAPAALRAVLERAVADLAPRAAGDPGLQREVLRMCVQHADRVDSAGRLFEALEEGGVGLLEALFYEAYALHLEKCRSHAEAEAVYELGIQRGARPLQRLEGAFQGFQGRMSKRRERDERRARKENRARAKAAGAGEKAGGGEAAPRQPLCDSRTLNRPAESVCSGASAAFEPHLDSVQKPPAPLAQQSIRKKPPAPAALAPAPSAENATAPRDSLCSPFASVARSTAATPSGELPSRSLEILGTPLGRRLEGDNAMLDMDESHGGQTGGTLWTSDAMFDSFVFASGRDPAEPGEGVGGAEGDRVGAASVPSPEEPAGPSSLPRREERAPAAAQPRRPTLSPYASLDGSFMSNPEASNPEVTLHTEKAFECIDAMFEKTLNLEDLPRGGSPQKPAPPPPAPGGELLVYEDTIHSTADLLL